MIPANPSKTTCRRYVSNVLTTYARATEDQLARGKAWYGTAHELAGILAGGDTYQGAGVLAALSANKSWPLNIKLATRAFADGEPSGHFRDALDKAARILGGEDPVDVLPMRSKTGNFFRCIADPSDPEPVCIDRHAHDVAVGRTHRDNVRGLSCQNRYNALAQCYRTAAKRVGLLPSELQAICWTVHIETVRALGAYGYALGA
jgi:hypothetical protein